MLNKVIVLFPLLLASCSQLNNHEIAEIFKAILLISFLLIFNISAFKSKKAYKDIAIWLSIFIVLLVGYSYRHLLLESRIISELVPNRAISSGSGEIIISRSNNGHFMVSAIVNGARINFLLDTGATDIVLDPQDAKKIGIKENELRYIKVYQTANGMIRAAPIEINSIKINKFQFYNIRASVSEKTTGVSLLGMTFLDLFSSYEVKGNQIYLRR